jgi:hypothetical protein
MRKVLTIAGLALIGIGSHVLKIYMIDPGVVLDKIVIDAGGIRRSYLGPPETKIGAFARGLSERVRANQ